MIEAGTFLAERYEIVEQIGTGGMADVYKAKDHKLNRHVAVKVLKQEFREDKTFNSKFRAEAQSAAGLMHPNIVSVYDVGEEGELHYIVMELIEGITLKEYIRKKGRLGYKEAISIAIQVCNGIDVAHKNQIIHRDIKPHNIMISRDGKVKVTDFGIARATSSNTISSNAMGSVHYTSPEQARGGYSDAKSDIYSLGITLYEMVTGRVPFDGDTTVAIAIKHLQEEIVPPTEYAEDLPASLEQIIIKCTQKGADRRYSGMEDLVADLKRSLTDPDGEFVNLIPINNDGQTVVVGEEELSEIKQTTGTMMFDLDDEDDFDDFDDEDDDEDEEDVYDEDEEDEDVNPRIGRIMKILRIVMAVIIVCIVVFIIGRATGLFGSSDKEEEIVEEEVTVPGLIGMTEDEAKEAAKELGLKIKVGPEVESKEDEAGTVVQQDPEAGETVKEGDTITINLGAGETEDEEPEEETVAVPDVVGETESAAATMLSSAGFEVKTEFQYSSSVANGKVISSSPGAGSMAAKGSTVNLIISKGEEQKTVDVPNVTGKSESEAKSTLTGKNLKVTVDSAYSDTVASGKVISQNPGAGSTVNEGSTVKIVVSMGPEPAQTETKTFNFDPVDTGDFLGQKITIKIVRSDTGDTIHNSQYDCNFDEFKVADFKMTVDAGVTSVSAVITITDENGDNHTTTRELKAK